MYYIIVTIFNQEGFLEKFSFIISDKPKEEFRINFNGSEIKQSVFDESCSEAYYKLVELYTLMDVECIDLFEDERMNKWM